MLLRCPLTVLSANYHSPELWHIGGRHDTLQGQTEIKRQCRLLNIFWGLLGQCLISCYHLKKERYENWCSRLRRHNLNILKAAIPSSWGWVLCVVSSEQWAGSAPISTMESSRRKLLLMSFSSSCLGQLAGLISSSKEISAITFHNTVQSLSGLAGTELFLSVQKVT